MDDKKWMHLALEEAKKGYSEGEVPIGAVIVKDNTVVCSAHNRCRQLNDPSSHAECIAIKEAYEKLHSLSDCTLYFKLEPCAMCAGTILQFRLPRLVFGAYEPLTGCCGSKIDLLDHWFNNSTCSIGGILEEESRNLLSEFFQSLRMDMI